MTFDLNSFNLTDQGKTLDARCYFSKEIFEFEQTNLFARHWQLVGHVSEFSQSGDHKKLQIGRIPVIVLKTENGDIKGFHNVCRHRAGPLKVQGKDCPRLNCQYHGWSYDGNGQLIQAPQMDNNAEFDKTQIQLPEVQLACWNGLIFATINSTAKPDELWQGISEAIAPVDLNQFKYSHSQSYQMRCNWKIYMDNYMEGYHVPVVHPGLNRVLKFQQYHTEVMPNYSYQWSPLKAGNNDEKESVYQNGRAHYFALLPNMMLNILPHRLQTNRVIPLTANTTEVVFDYYYDNFESNSVAKMIAEDKNFSDEVQQEDIQICEEVQFRLESGSYQQGIYCQKMEQALIHFHDSLRKLYRTGLQNKGLQEENDQ